MSILSKKKVLLSLLCVSILLNIGIATYFGYEEYSEQKNTHAIDTHPLLSRRAINGSRNDVELNFLQLREQLHQKVDPYQDTFAFYFEYLPTGTAIGINEDSEFTAASLLKIPVVMAYLHMKEQNGSTDDPVVAIQPNELNNKYGDLYKKGAGYQIKLSDAVKHAITESDNTASLVLADQITNDDFSYVYEGLDIPMAVQGDSPIITAIQYSSVLKALYFSSILNPDDSEYVLDLMTQTKFTDMLPPNRDKSIKIAHKIGLIDDQIYQDCGIYYVTNRPYTLCMISKSDKKTAEQREREVSQMVYNYVTTVK